MQFDSSYHNNMEPHTTKQTHRRYTFAAYQKCDRVQLQVNKNFHWRMSRVSLLYSRRFVWQICFLCYILQAFLNIIAVTEDGTVILIIRKKAVQRSLSEHLQENKLGLGCRYKDGKVIFDAKTCNEVQLSMHVTNTSKALLVIVNANNLSDLISEEFTYDPLHFKNKLDNKLQGFFENVFIKEVIKQDVRIKN